MLSSCGTRHAGLGVAVVTCGIAGRVEPLCSYGEREVAATSEQRCTVTSRQRRIATGHFRHLWSRSFSDYSIRAAGVRGVPIKTSWAATDDADAVGGDVRVKSSVAVSVLSGLSVMFLVVLRQLGTGAAIVPLHKSVVARSVLHSAAAARFLSLSVGDRRCVKSPGVTHHS